MSENTREITLEEAKKLYNSSEEAKVFLLSKFTKEELEGKAVPSQEEFNKFFEENIFSQIDYSKTKFLNDVFLDGIGYISTISKTPTSKITLCNSNNAWLFAYDYDQKNTYFYYSHNHVFIILYKYFSLSYVEINQFMENMVNTLFNLHSDTIERL
jgi:hypothetical protein